MFNTGIEIWSAKPNEQVIQVSVIFIPYLLVVFLEILLH